MRSIAFFAVAAVAANAIANPFAAPDAVAEADAAFEASVDNIFVGDAIQPSDEVEEGDEPHLEARAARRQGVPAGPVAKTYQDAVRLHHNYHRGNHSAPALKWSPRMASIARATAQKCVYEHDTQTGGGGYGQNIAAGAPLKDIAAVITEQFYNNEVNLYPRYGTNNPDMSNFHAWGHMSQIVWTDTREVGCYTFDCSKKRGGLKKITGVYSNIAPHFTVCNYFPPGNYGGQFTKVRKPINRVTINGKFRVDNSKFKQINPPKL